MSWGIADGHLDVAGNWVAAHPAGVAAALAAMRASWSSSPPPPTTWVVTVDERVNVPAPAVLVLEDGGSMSVKPGPLPSVPLGYHSLDFGDQRVRLIVSPGRCVLPAARLWGWAVQLYAVRSARSWGMGDLGDLRRLARWGAASGAGVILVNPLHAPAPTPRQQPSPYFPSSRRWRNPLYLRVEEVPGAIAALGTSLDGLAAAGRALNDSRTIDRDEVWRLKSAALEQIWAGADSAYEDWARAQGPSLEWHATYNALAEVHGGDWRQWPAELRSVGTAVAPRERVDFHRWLQWLIDGQLAEAASAGAGIVGDLAVGADPGGADSWIDQDLLAPGVTVGAPPDDFVPEGQDWGIPPWDPWRLRAAGYEPFVALVRAAMAHGVGLRLDHVAGLFRQFWVPAGLSPAEGVYVSYPWADLCNIVALESARAGAWVVGEDLGTVAPEVRDELARRNLLSYRLLWFEDAPPSDWPTAALAAVSTHDLPTISGTWSGADGCARRAIGVAVDDAAESDLRRRLVAVGSEARLAYGALGESPCLVVAATLEDALGVDERPNMPGTTDGWPNWSMALPASLEAIETDARVGAVARAMRRTRSRP